MTQPNERMTDTRLCGLLANDPSKAAILSMADEIRACWRDRDDENRRVRDSFIAAALGECLRSSLDTGCSNEHICIRAAHMATKAADAAMKARV